VSAAALASLGLLLATAQGFEQRPERCESDLLLDLRLPPSVELDQLAPALSATGLRAVLLLRPAQVEGLEALVSELQAEGHELGLWVPGVQLPGPQPGSPGLSWGELRRDRRQLRRVSGQPVRAAGAPRLERGIEGSLDIFGFTLLLPAADGVLQAPRSSLDLQGRTGSGVVLWPVQPRSADEIRGPEGSLTALLDRSAAALERGEHPVVRLSLPATVALRHSALLGSWRQEVLEPCGAALLSRPEAERATRDWLREQARRPAHSPLPAPSAPAVGLVGEDQLTRLAEGIIVSVEAGGTLPRSPDGELDLCQAWLALALASLGQSPPLAVHRVRPPQGSSRSVLPPEGIALERAALLAAVAGQIPAPEQQIPSFVRVGEQALTAAELLYALALAHRGDPIIQARPAFSPAPFTPGLGWD
jgi:hypothetical protein